MTKRIPANLVASLSRTSCLCALLLFVAFALGQWQSSATSVQRNQVQETNSPQTLTLGVPRGGEIAAGGQTDVWQIDLSAGDYLQVSFSRQIKLDAKLFAPAPSGQEKKILFSVKDREVIYSGRQNLNLCFVVEVSGTYGLEISPFSNGKNAVDKNPAQGRYELKIEALRPATPEDKLRVAAESAAVEGELLIQSDATPDGWRRGIAKYNEALAIWRELDDRREELRLLVITNANQG